MHRRETNEDAFGLAVCALDLMAQAGVVIEDMLVKAYRLMPVADLIEECRLALDMAEAGETGEEPAEHRPELLPDEFFALEAPQHVAHELLAAIVRANRHVVQSHTRKRRRIA